MTDLVLCELERLLADNDFGASPRRREMLAYVVSETLAGRSDRLKGVVVAQEVFGRDADFDQQTDPVVRIEARRLRRDLDSYYAQYADKALVRFSIPKGAYAAEFELIERPPPTPGPETPTEPDKIELSSDAGRLPPRRWRPRYSTTAVLTLAIACGILLFMFWPRTPGARAALEPGIVVMPFSSTGASKETDFLARYLTDQLVHDLMPFGDLRVYALADDRPDLGSEELHKLQEGRGVDYVVSGNLYSPAVPGKIRLLVSLRKTDGKVLWSGSFDRQVTAGEMTLLQGDLVQGIASTLGQAYGVIATDVAEQIAADPFPSDSTFDCLLRAYAFRRYFSPELRQGVSDCVAKAVVKDPGNSDVWAMTGWLRLDQALFPDIPAAERISHLDAALEATQKAVTLSPQSTLALQAHAAVLHHRGSYSESEQVMRAALALNPADPELLHQIGWRLAVRGKFDEGVDFIRQAIDRSIDPPSRYYNLIAIQDFTDERYDDMLVSARAAARGDSSVGNALLAIASAASADGTPAEIAKALERMTSFRPELARDPGGVFLRHGLTPEITTKLVKALDKVRADHQSEG